MTLSTGGFDLFSKTTRRAVFLAEIDRVMPWSALCALIKPIYPKAGNGRPPLGLERMLRIHFLQNWFNRSDPAAGEALYDSLSMRSFVGVDSKTKLIHSVVAASANVHDKHPIPQLLHGNENRIYGDSAYASQKKLIAEGAPKAKDFTNQKGSRHKPPTDRERERNRTKSQVRAKVEHAFLIIKRIVGFAKGSYRGLK